MFTMQFRDSVSSTLRWIWPSQVLSA